MKTKQFLLFLSLIGLSYASHAQLARVQAIHNCPDPAAATVDIWLNNILLIDNFDYKEASPFIDAPAMVDFVLSVCAPNSTDTVGAIFKKSFNLPMNSTNVVVASGGLGETGATAFDLRPYVGLEQGVNQGASEISVNIIHGSYDAPMVDIYEVQIPAGQLANDVSFGQSLGSYTNLPAADFDVQIRTQSGVVAAEFDVNVSGLSDSSAIILATGFLDPASAVGNEPFGLIAVLPNGTVINLPGKPVTAARLQVIHNCSATDAAQVDVWLNAGPAPLLDNFGFRTASPFIDAPAGQFFDVSIALPNSIDTVSALFKQTFILESAKTYIVVASGTVGSGTYSPATPFSLEVITDARETASIPGNVDVIVWHGATDAPSVDVVETQVGAGTIVDNLAYGNASAYLELSPVDFDLNITDMSGTTTLFSYDANLSAFSDSAITVLASGFVDPIVNNNGPAFGLWVALAKGGNLIQLPALSTGIKNIDKIQGMQLYPNPADRTIEFSFESELAQNFIYTVRAVDGREVSSGSMFTSAGTNSNRIEIGELAKGYYYLVLQGENNSGAIPFIKE